MKLTVLPAALAVIALMLAGGATTVRGQSALDGFDPNADGPILVVVVQPDGKILIGGRFTSLFPRGVGIKRNCIARLNPDGTVDPSFNPDANGVVRAIAVQANGDIFIGGDFTTLSPNGGAPVVRNRIAQLSPSGILVSRFDPGADGSVRAIAIQGPNILVGGRFTVIAGASRANIARLRLAPFSGWVADGFNPGPNGTVNAIAVNGGSILVGGAFTQVSGITRNRIAALSSSSGQAELFDPNANNSVFSIVPQADGKILVGGIFSQIGGASRGRIARVDPATGVADSFDPKANGDVYTIAVQADGRILLGGLFDTIGGATRTAIARVEPATGLPDSFQLTMNGQVFSIAVQPDGKSVAAGDFTISNGQTRNRIARMEIDGRLDQTLRVDVVGTGSLLDNGWPTAIAVQTDGKILLGGSFTSLSPNGAAPVTRNNIARLNTDGTFDNAFNPNANSFLTSVAVQADGKILTGGQFTNIGGATRNHLARLDGTTGLADSFNPNASGVVEAITVQRDGKILVGGEFTTIGAVTRRRIARLDATTGLADSFNPNANSPVRSIAVQADGKILVGGSFTNIGGQPRNNLARLDATSGLADSFNPNPSFGVTSITVQPDGKILVGGDFTQIGGVTRNRIARLNSDGTLDPAFNPNANDGVTTISMQADGKILVGGFFDNIGGQTRDSIARLSPIDGLADSFNPTANTIPFGFGVYGIAVQADGKIVVGGIFNRIGGESRLCLARLSNDIAALQDLVVTQTTITWTRGGSSPQFTRATFESSPDNVNFTFLGHGTASGSSWVLTGLNLPAGENTIIRARGFYRSGDNNGSESVVGSRRNAFFSPLGRFVIGDRNAVVGQRVVFYGAEWAKWNSLSGGPAPASFKGFANSLSTNPPACAGTWNSDAGNNAALPPRLPAKIEVIVASSITKSGASISGNIPTMAVVEADPGYDGSPNHAGTGTVVSVSCDR